MTSALEVSSIFNEQDVSLFTSLKDIRTAMKELNEKDKKLSKRIKKLMQDRNIDSVSMGDYSFKLIPVPRKTIVSGKKQELISTLLTHNKKHLLKYQIEPDLESIVQEMNSHAIDPGLVNQYIHTTDCLILHCSVTRGNQLDVL